MKILLALATAALLIPATTIAADKPSPTNAWINLFNGKDLAGWKLSDDSPQSFQVKDGILIVAGPRAHMYYVGNDGKASFRNFEFEAMILTKPKANSGIFIHTRWQADGWPDHGYEAQVNATHGDAIKTGSIYNVKHIMNEAPHRDDEWFKYTITVQGKRIIIKVNDKIMTDYTEPDEPGHATRKLSQGTIAIQAHDPNSVIHYKNIRLRELP